MNKKNFQENITEYPLVSVVMSIYSEPEDWLRESIDSILNQTFLNYEFIIINDNPDREFNRILLEEYLTKDPRIIIINNDENIGLTKSLNKGLDIVRGDFIARMDADDWSFPERLRVQYEFMYNNENIGACGSYIEYFGNISRHDKSYFLEPGYTKSSLIFKNPIAHPTAFIRNAILKKYNIQYDESFSCTQDYKLWSDLSPFTLLANIPQVLLKYRVQKKQISQSKSNIQIDLAKSIRLFETEKYMGLLFQDFIKIKDKRKQFNYVLRTQKKSKERSFLLLTIYLSFEDYKLSDLLKVIIYTNLHVIIKNLALIIKKNINPRKYPGLI
jgi:glycosyltransferase involved in cell wall biosynthesis